MKKYIYYFSFIILSIGIIVFIDYKKGVSKVQGYSGIPFSEEDVSAADKEQYCNGQSYAMYLLLDTEYDDINYVAFDYTLTNATDVSIVPYGGFTTFTPNNTMFGMASNRNISSGEKIAVLCYNAVSDIDLVFTPSNAIISHVQVNTLKGSLVALNTPTSTTDISSVEYNTIYYYKIVLESNSVISTDNTTLSITVPTEVVIKDADGGTVDGKTISWNVGSINPSAKKEYVIKVQVDPDDYNNYNATTIEADMHYKVGSESTVNKHHNVMIIYPNLVLSITPGVVNIKRGETYTYHVTVDNTGFPAYNVNVSSGTLDSRIKVVGTNATSYSKSYDTIGSEDKSFDITVQVDPDAALGSLSQTFTVTSDNYKNVQQTVTVNIIDASMGITSSVDKETARIGDTVTWSATVNNAGTASSNSYQIVSTLPDSLEVVSATGATIEGNTVTWSASSLSSGGSVTKSVVARVKNTVSDGDEISNTFTLKESGLSDKTATKSIIVSESALTVTNTTPSDVYRPGDEYTYTVSVKNNGSNVSKSVTLEDTIDSRLELVNSSSATINGQKLTWSLGTIAANETKTTNVTVRVKDVATNTNITNSATAKESGKADITTNKNITIKKAHLILSGKIYNTDISKELSTISLGEEFINQITLMNDGDASGSNIALVTEIDSHLDIVDSDGGTVTGNKIAWNVSEVSTTGGVVKKVRLRLKDGTENGTSITNTAVATGNYLSATFATGTVVADGDISAIQYVDKNYVKVKDNLSYTIRIGNRSDSAISNITIEDTIPEEFNLVTINADSNVVTTTNITGGKSFVISSIPANETIDIVLNGTIKENVTVSSIITNRIKVMYDDTTFNNIKTVSVVDSKLDANIVVSSPTVLNNEEFMWTITVKNTGTGTADNLKITDYVPNGVTIVSCDNCQNNSSNLVWQISSLGTNETKSFVIKAKASNQEAGTKLTNRMVVEEPGKDNIEKSVDVEIVKYKITIDQRASVSKAKIGDTFKITIVVKNVGSTSVSNVDVLDGIDPALEVIKTDATVGNNKLDWIVNLTLGQEKTFEFTVRVKKGAATKEAINTVSIIVDNEEITKDIMKITLDVDTINPNTGSIISYITIGLSIVFAIVLFYLTNKKRRFFKI